jgi:iron complex transport system substrate-binding protein
MKRDKSYSLILFLILLGSVLLPGYAPAADSFLALGEFSVLSLGQGRYEVTDGLGRVLTLIPRDQPLPPGLAQDEVIRIPVQRLAAYSGRDASLLQALGVVESVVGVTGDPQSWIIPAIKEGLASGRVVSLGSGASVDLERLFQLKPEVVFTWDESIIPKMSELGIPTLITYGQTAADLETHLNFARFLAPFFGREEKAEAFVKRVNEVLEAVTRTTAKVKTRPKVIWGDIYEKRVLVEPGNSWAAQLVKAVGGDYLFNDIAGSS